MGQLQAGISALHRTMKTLAGTSIVCGAVTKTCVASPAMRSKGLVQVGFLPDVEMMADVVRADFVSLGIVDRSLVTINGQSLIVMLIEDDDQDPVVKLHLKRAHV